MKSSSTATSRLSTPMSKRTVFTTITPLPPHITRAAIVDFLHNYETMIDINPLVTDRYRIPPPQNADPDEANCVWYQLTDAVVMPWSASSPTSASDNIAAKQKSGNVSYTCAFHPLPDGLQTHCRAPLGVDIRDRWTVGGTLPGEPRQPMELGLDALGAPASGLYLREDVDLRCNRLMAGFVKKTLKKSHEAVVQKLNSDLAGTNSPVAKSPVDQRGASGKAEKIRPVSASPTTLAQRPAPYRVYPQPNQSLQRRRPDPQSQYEPFQPQPEQLHVLQQTLQYRRPHSQQCPPSFSPSQAHQQYQLHRQQKQHPPPYRSHQHAHSYSRNAPVPALVQPQTISVPASLAVGPPPSQQNTRQAQQQKQQQNQQLQRTLHPDFPQPEKADDRIAVDISAFSSSPSMSFSSVSTSSTALTGTTAVLPSPCPSSASSSSSPLPSPAAIHCDRFRLSASPLTRLQLQLPKVTTVFPPPTTGAAEMGSTSNDNKIVGNELFAEKEQRHSLYQQLLPPLVFSAREVVASEPRRKSTGSEATSAGTGGGISGIDRLPFHDLSLCPQPLRIGGQRRASAGQSQQPGNLQPQPLIVAQPREQSRKPIEQSPPVKSYQALDSAATTQPTEPAKPAEPANTAPAVQIDYPEMNPYVYNEEDYEDIVVDTPILASDEHAKHNGPYSPTVFAELDNGSSSNSSNDNSSAPTTIDAVVTATKVPEWQQWRDYLHADMD
ncbi:hypothetical protein SEUCBS139899_002618 [Sporothrix eucalyptigena]